MNFYIPEIVFNLFEIEENKQNSINELKEKISMKENNINQYSEDDKNDISISILMLKYALNEAIKNDCNFVNFINKCIMLTNKEDKIIPFFGNEKNPFALIFSFDNLSESEYMSLSRLKLRNEFKLIDSNIFKGLLNNRFNSDEF